MRSTPIEWKIRRCVTRLGLWTLLERARFLFHFARKKPHECDFLFFRRFTDREYLLLDIGANAGQSALSVGALNKKIKIISFEPNRLMQKNLEFVKRLLGANFEYFLYGIGATHAVQTLYIPFVDGVPLSGEATFRREILTDDPVTRGRIQRKTGSKDFETKGFEFEIKKVSQLGLDPDFIKIDVQGFEYQVVRGMEQILQSQEPILLIENGTHLPPILTDLRQIGFEAYQYLSGTDEMVRWVGQDTLNVFFIGDKRRQQLHAQWHLQFS